MDASKLSKRLIAGLHDTSFVAKIKRLSRDSLFGVIDQGLFSTSNFLINVFFGRWLSESDYGLYAILYTVFLFLSTLQSSLIFEPMAVFGPGDFLHKGKSYFNSLITIQFGLTILLSGIIFTGALFFGPAIRQLMIGLAVSLSFILLYWFLRQACYVEMRPRIAALTSALYALINIGGLFFAQRFSMIHNASPFYIMCLSSIFASFAAMILLGFRVSLRLDETVWVVIAKHWNYGKWLLASTIPNSVSTFMYIPMIGVLVGLPYSAAFKAIQNLILPVQQIFAILTLIFLPRLSRSYYSGDHSSVTKNSILFLGVNFAVLIPFLALLLPLSSSILNFMYQNSFYDSYDYLLPMWGICLALGVIIQTIANLLRISEATKPILFAKMGSAFVIIFVGYFAIRSLNFDGRDGNDYSQPAY